MATAATTTTTTPTMFHPARGVDNPGARPLHQPVNPATFTANSASSNQNCRGGGYGLDAALAESTAAKYDHAAEGSARRWIQAVTGTSVSGAFGPALKDGTLLCRFINRLCPGAVSTINQSPAPFKQRENVSNFLIACRGIGVPETALFETVDLFELKDVGLIVRCLHTLSRTLAERASYHGLLLEGQLPARPASAVAAMSSVSSSASDAAPTMFRAKHHQPNTNTTTTTASSSLAQSGFYAPSSSYSAQARPVEVGDAGKGRSAGFGIDADIAAAQEREYDHDAERRCRIWIECITGTAFTQSFKDELRDGTRLCLLVNRIKPGSVAQVNTSSAFFKQAENISNFLIACRRLGVPETALFETVDLHEQKAIGLVVRCIFELGRAARRCGTFSGPALLSIEDERSAAALSGKPDVQQARLPPNHGGDDAETTANMPSMFRRRQQMQVDVNSALPAHLHSPAPGGVFNPDKPSSYNRPVACTSGGYAAASAPQAVSVGNSGKGRSAGWGLDADIAKRQEANYDKSLETKARLWIESITGAAFTRGFGEELQDGQRLCQLINCIQPGTIRAVSSSTSPFKRMENITNFLVAARALGVPESGLFETEDLFQLKDLGLVVRGLFALGKTLRQRGIYSGPQLVSAEEQRAHAAGGFNAHTGCDTAVPAAFRGCRTKNI